MLDHLALSITADKYQEVLDFYLAALAPLGYEIRHSIHDGKVVGLGCKDAPAHEADFWLAGFAQTASEIKYAHWAFKTDDRKVVDDFHAKALAAGGKDNGAPGPRPQYGPHYYGSFITDPIGNNIEVVCKKPE